MTTTTTITEYDPIAAGLDQLRDRYLETTYEVETTDGMKLAIAARAELRTLRLEVERVRVEIKAPALAALKRCRVSDTEAKRQAAERARLATEEAVVRAEADRQANVRAEADAAAERKRDAELTAALLVAERAEADAIEHVTLVEAARDVVARFEDWGVADELPARKLAAAVERADGGGGES